MIGTISVGLGGVRASAAGLPLHVPSVGIVEAPSQ